MSIELENVTSGYNLSLINTNFQKVEDYINDKVLHRGDSSVAGEAKMERDLDMNGFSILNADLNISSLTNDRAIRVPVGEGSINALPSAEDRKGKVLTFDINTGLPIVSVPASGSAIDVLNQIALPTGSSLVGYKYPGTATPITTVKAKLDRYASVKDYGAKGDGVTNDSAAIQAMIDEGHSVIYFPAGSYLINTQISWQGKNLEFIGESKQNTELVTSTNIVMFRAGYTNPVGSVKFDNLRFITTTATTSAGIDIKFDGAAGSTLGYRRPQAMFTNLIFQGRDIFNGGFIQCITTTDALLPTFEDITMTFKPALDGTQIGNGIKCLTSVGGVAVYKFHRVYTLFGARSIQILSSTAPGLEGIYISDCDFVYPITGVEAINSDTSSYKPPQLYIYNTHVEAFNNAVAVDGFSQVNIHDTLFYKSNDSTDTGPLIYMTNCLNSKLHDITLETRPNNTAVAGIVLNNCFNTDVHDILGSTRTSQPIVSLTSSSSGANNKVRDIKQYGPGVLVVDSNPTLNQATSSISSAASGYQWRGDILDQWGTVSGTVTSGGDLAINFPRAFTSWVSIVAVNSNASAGVQPVTIHTKTLTGFVANFGGASSVAREVTYHVMGV